MIFASDLDRTLIYTKKLIDAAHIKHVVLVERYLGKELSFMTKNTIEKLKLINNKILFIPVTTRTTEQYNRIFGIKEEINPKYVVTSNGGIILEHGEINIEWNKIIKRVLTNSTRASIVEKQFLKSFSDLSWINKMVFRDDLFFSVHFDEINNNSKEELKNFENWIIKNQWHISLQGKKLYIVPNEVNKWNAISYIKDKEKKQKIISAGDSYLDYPILINANYSIGALHGELKNLIDKNKIQQKHIVMSKKSGIEASEEILDFVNDIVNCGI
ncbi:HAD-IIB family hydrolase [Clostridium sporogenes]|uniref:HAD-IIB family hydrolase n=1 Tax=Clostridium sporogenes TaxID=1509 RepID=UPI001F1ECEC8|nr:HAD-IIB family hydrolase [Clostridium sporogenes]MCF4015898.1 HAD-IIB family hydrolase [Clostridium sporogenes]